MSRPERRTKRAVVVTARVHPGETNGSWMMEGFLDFLLGDSEDAQLLRDTFVFKVMVVLKQEVRTSGTVLLCLVIFFVICLRCPAGGAHVESRWGDRGKLSVLFSGQGPQQKLPDIAQRFISLCVAHPKHGGEVGQG